MMSLPGKSLLLLGTALLYGAFGAACASGVDGKETDPSPAETEDSGEPEEEPEEEAGEPQEPEDAGTPDAPDAGMDSGTKDAGSDAGAKDAALDAALDTSLPDTGASPADTGTTDAARDAGRPVPAPLPAGKPEGEWTYVEPQGALCRDGSSKAGYFYRTGGDSNVMIFLNGSGACTDAFFCSVTPKSVDESFAAESIVEASASILDGKPVMARQLPPNEGILKRDARNPVANWNMVFVPYCTGDVHAGSKPNATVPGVEGQQQFVGYTNLGLILKSIGPSFSEAQKVLLAGTGAGGFGALLNMERTQDFFAAQGAKVSVITDSGIPFQDQFLAACLQKKWRDIWNLDAIMPPNCTGCRNANGGGLALGLGTYLFKERFKDRMMGGMVSSAQDDIIRLFFSAGVNNCMTDPGVQALAMLFGSAGDFTPATFRSGLSDTVNNVAGASRVGYYVIPGGAHMHLWRPRFYSDNGLGSGATMASWVADIIAGMPTHRGTL
jgi:hypothetical protein